MKIEEVRRRLGEIERKRHDDEAAHSMEDQLHQDVLTAIANGHPDARLLAGLALESGAIGFARWCA